MRPPFQRSGSGSRSLRLEASSITGERLSLGVDLKGLEVAKLRIRGLGRGYIFRLAQNGYDTPNALTQLSIDELEKFLPTDVAREVVKQLSSDGKLGAEDRVVRDNRAEPEVQQAQNSRSKAILVVDRKHPGTIEYRGKTPKLTSKQFWLLAALAETPARCVPYDSVYKQVWGDDVVVEMQQISYHKPQLLKKLSRAASKAEVKGLVTPVSGEGLILVLKPSNVALT